MVRWLKSIRIIIDASNEKIAAVVLIRLPVFCYVTWAEGNNWALGVQAETTEVYAEHCITSMFPLYTITEVSSYLLKTMTENSLV